MFVTAPTNNLFVQQQNAHKLRSFLIFTALVALCALVMIEPALAGTGTGTGGAASTRVRDVVTGWQTIIVAAGVGILVIAWSIIGYFIAFGGKTMKDMMNPLIGSTVAGLAPVLVGWMFS
jgi:TrbC/VIRB2 pilin